jgi:hypothetical protein
MLAVLLFALTTDCVSTSLQCGARVQASGCTRFRFEGRTGDIITATMRPINTPLTAPRLSLEIPVTGFHAPVVTGGAAATLRYCLPASGAYALRTEADGAPYYVAFDCHPDVTPDIPRDCIREDLAKGQRVEWELTDEACRWPAADHFQVPFAVYAVAGDPITITMKSPFAPRIGVYTYDLAIPQVVVDRSTATFVAPISGRYLIMPSSAQPGVTGPFELTMSSRESGCITPLIFNQPPDVAVPYGLRATLSVSVNDSGQARTWDWLDMSALPTLAGSQESFVTPPVTSKQYYAARITNRCGSALSRTIVVSPGTTHRRP